MEKENHNNIFGISELNCSSSFFKPNWELNSMDQTDPFESALSSMVSSPTASSANGNANNGESIVLRELIGRLGSICNSGEISPQQQNPNFVAINGNHSANASCYSTPLNSPPKLNLSNPNLKLPHQGIQFPSLSTLAPFSTDPGFAERAARFSSFASKNENGDSRENSSSVSEQIPAVEIGNSRKRKSAPKGKGKEAPSKDANVVASENSESSAKRSKSDEEKDGEKQSSKDNSKPPEAPKDYIHVRARRGQATDAHSLAERVRREKISERMKVLQDLVPGCNKVTGKAVMLDEIINYVQSLQRQVEFLSMKLATVNPRMDYNMEALMSSKDMFQSRGTLRHNMYPSDNYSNMNNDNEAPFPSHNVNAALSRNQLPPMDNFSETASQVSNAFWEDDLHSIVQMGFGQNQTQSFQGILSTAQMKVEL